MRPRHELAVAIATPFSPSSGTLRDLYRLERLRDLPTYERHTVKVGRGERIGSVQEGFLPPLSVEFEDDDLDRVHSDLGTLSGWRKNLFVVDG